MVFNAVLPQGIYLNEITCLLKCLNIYVLHKIGPGISDSNVHVQKSAIVVVRLPCAFA